MNSRRVAWAFALLALPLAAAGADYTFTAGPSVTSAGHHTEAVFFSAYGATTEDGHAHFAPIVSAGWMAPHATHEDHLHHTVGLAAAGVRWQSPQRRWFASEQLAAVSQRTEALSSRFEFMTSVGWQHGYFVVMLRHISNAHVLGGGKNLGETMLLAGVRF